MSEIRVGGQTFVVPPEAVTPEPVEVVAPEPAEEVPADGLPLRRKRRP